MEPTKHVLLATTGSMVIYIAAGGSINKLQAKLRRQPTTEEAAPVVAYSLAGWGTVFLVLVFVSDIEPVAPLATGFAWLIFLGVALAFGGDAAANIGKLMGQQPGSNGGKAPSYRGREVPY